jgi:hypothetical protein
LPASTQVMISGVDGEEEIRIPVACADPGAIYAPPGREAFSTSRDQAGDVFVFAPKNINKGFSGLWLRHGVLLLVRFHREPDFVGAAARSGTRGCGLILRKNRRSEKKHR